MKPLIPDRRLLQQLIDHDGGDLASLIIPTHQRGRDVAQDRIRFKNALSEIDEKLEKLQWKQRQRSDRLAGATELVDDGEFWEHQSDALAVYIAEDGVVTPVSLSRQFSSLNVVMSVFLVRPVVVSRSQPAAMVLALTLGAVALYEASASDIQQIDADMPKSFEDVNWFVDRERQRQQHPDRAGGSRNRHGHTPDTREHEDVDRFLRAVLDALPDMSDDEKPLIVLGDDDLVSRFDNLGAQEITSPANSGLSSPVDETAVHAMAVGVLDDVRSQREEKATNEAMEQLGLGNATHDLAEAVSYARSGRVGSLVFEAGTPPRWGRVDDSNLAVEIHESQAPADVDLVDRLVVYALRSGAEIHPVTSSIDGHPVVAIQRF